MAAAESAPSGCDPDGGLRRDLPPGRWDDRRSWRKYGGHVSDRETAGAYFYRIRDTTPRDTLTRMALEVGPKTSLRLGGNSH